MNKTKILILWRLYAGEWRQSKNKCVNIKCQKIINTMEKIKQDREIRATESGKGSKGRL